MTSFDFVSLAIHLGPLKSLFPGFFSLFGAVVYLIVALALIFVGRKIARILAFFVVGLGLGAVGAFVGSIIPIAGTAIGFVLGFLVGGMLGLLLLRIAIGVAIGLFAFYAVQALFNVEFLSIIVALILTVAGILLARRIMGVATAIIGALLFLDLSVVFFHIAPPVATAASIILAAVGSYIQWPRHHNRVGLFASHSFSSGGPSADPRRAYCLQCGTVASMASEYCSNCGVRL